jgi:hypothetical protein
MQAHLAIWSKLKLQELVPIFACVAYIVSQVELVCHLLLCLPAWPLSGQQLSCTHFYHSISNPLFFDIAAEARALHGEEERKGLDQRMAADSCATGSAQGGSLQMCYEAKVSPGTLQLFKLKAR